jgi:putative ABC transport system permease protein
MKLFYEAVVLALNTIKVQKLKSFFTLLGVTIGVMFLIAVVSIVEGMSKYVEEDFAGRILGANTFTLRRYPWFGNNVTEAEWREWQRRPRVFHGDVVFIKGILPTGTRYAVESQERLYVGSQYVSREKLVEVHAVEGDYFEIKKYVLTNGRAIAPQEFEQGEQVVVIGQDIASFFYPNLNPVDRVLKIRGLPYRIVGVLEKQGSLFGQSLDAVVIGTFGSSLSRATNPRGDIDGLLVQAPTDLMMSEAMETVREELRARRHLRPGQVDNFVMETSESALQGFRQVKGIMTIAGTALPAIGLIVGGMVIMNIMLVAVAERTREIGIRKSLGARRRDILNQFLVESATLSTVGAMIGIALGILIAKIISWNFSALPAAVAPWSIVVATLLGTVVGIVSGVVPARRASRLDPIEALRQE